MSIGSKEKTAVELASEVISENGDLFGLYNVTIHERNHKINRVAVPSRIR